MTTDADAGALFRIFSTGSRMDQRQLKFPPYINVMREKDWPIRRIPDAIGPLRLTAIDFIYSLGAALRQDDSICFAAARFFDRFYALPDIGASREWVCRARLVAFVALDIAAKTLGHETNCAGSVKTLRWFHTIAVIKCDFEAFRHKFTAIEVHMVQRIADDIMAPSPHEYVSECCSWYDAFNAARRPDKCDETAFAARMTSFLITVAAYTPSSVDYTSMEIAGVCSYTAAVQIRQDRSIPSPIETQLLADIWGEVTWSRANSLVNDITKTAMGLFADTSFVSGLEKLYPDIFEAWRDHMARQSD